MTEQTQSPEPTAPHPVGTMVLEISAPPDATPTELARISRAIAEHCRANGGQLLFYQRVPADVDIPQLQKLLTAAGLPVHGIRRSPRL